MGQSKPDKLDPLELFLLPKDEIDAMIGQGAGGQHKKRKKKLQVPSDVAPDDIESIKTIRAISRTLLGVVADQLMDEPPANDTCAKVWGDVPGPLCLFDARILVNIRDPRFRRFCDSFEVPSLLRDALVTDVLRGDVPSLWLVKCVRDWWRLSAYCSSYTMDFWLYTLGSDDDNAACLRAVLYWRVMGTTVPELIPTARRILERAIHDSRWHAEADIVVETLGDDTVSV